MISKEILKPGMVVKLNRGDICLITLADSLNNELKLSWDDDTNRSLNLKDYNDDLTYSTYEEYNINTIYDLPMDHSFTTENFEKRPVLWRRNNKIYFSLREKRIAGIIDSLFKDYLGCHTPILVKCNHGKYINVFLSNNNEPGPVLSFPGHLFPTIVVGQTVPLEIIINEQILQ